jgi:GT2 family glycosyltransferase
MDLSIIILNYKSTQKTLACLQSIFSSELSGISTEIIVVDNFSGDNIEVELKKLDKNIRFIQTGRNLGMGQGNNAGIAVARGEYIMILNADTTVYPESVNLMLRYIKSDLSIGIVGPKVVYPGGKLQITCMRFPKFYTPLLRRTFLGRFLPSI